MYWVLVLDMESLAMTTCKSFDKGIKLPPEWYSFTHSLAVYKGPVCLHPQLGFSK